MPAKRRKRLTTAKRARKGSDKAVRAVKARAPGKSRPKKAPTKGKAKPKPKPAPKPKPRPAPKPKPPPKPKPKPRPAPKRRPKPKPKPAPKRERSEAAQNGWLKRRKRKRLLDAMADVEMKTLDEEEDAQPIGWTQRRENLREIDGELWREIAVEFSETDYQARRLAILADLEIDFLTKGELYDYLSWAGDHFEIEISDMYQMYLGYSPGAGEGEG